MPDVDQRLAELPVVGRLAVGHGHLVVAGDVPGAVLLEDLADADHPEAG
jgi:hypothetical protein